MTALRYTTILSALILGLSSTPALADAETDALRAEVKALLQRIEQLEKRETAAAKSYSNIAPAAGKNTSVEKRLALVERKQELAEEDAKAKSEKNPTVEVGKKGLAITSADKQFGLKLTGYGQFDNRSFIHGAKGDDEFLARRLRPVISVQAYKDFSFRLMPDFAGSSTRVFDAHADYRHSDGLQFRIGKFKPPVGLERLQSAADVFFAERGHPTNLAPTRDFGFMIYGEPLPELEYQLGVFNGTSDLGNADGDDDNHKDIVARAFATPFKNSGTLALQGLGFGLAGSHGKHVGTSSVTQLPTYRTPGQASMFTYATNTFADGVQWRLYPQAYYYYNNVGLLGEYALSSQEVKLTTNKRRLTHDAWQVAGSYVLTGEDVNFKGGVKPANNFNPAGGGWGALELVARTGATDIDDDTFPSFASLNTQVTDAASYGAGVNWYLNETLKLAVNYDFTRFDRGATGGADRRDEHAVISRAQFRF